MTQARKIQISIALAMLLMIGGSGWYITHLQKCMAGGGGADFLPPASVKADEETVLALTLKSWGNTSCIQKKYWQDNVPRGLYTNVQCHFRVSGAPEFTAQKMNLIEDKADATSYHATYRCTIPAQSEKAGSQLEYYFDFGWPEKIHTLNQKPLPIE